MIIVFKIQQKLFRYLLGSKYWYFKFAKIVVKLPFILDIKYFLIKCLVLYFYFF